MRLLRLPLRRLVLDSDRSPDQLVKRLGADLDPDGVGLLAPPGQRGWIGFVKTDGMEIRRRTPFRSSFLPMVRARFEPKGKGTRVHVSMALRLITRFVLLAWVLLAVIATVGLFTTGQGIMLLVPAMLVAVYLMCSFAFHLEADVAEKHLRERIEP